MNPTSPTQKEGSSPKDQYVIHTPNLHSFFISLTILISDTLVESKLSLTLCQGPFFQSAGLSTHPCKKHALFCAGLLLTPQAFSSWTLPPGSWQYTLLVLTPNPHFLEHWHRNALVYSKLMIICKQIQSMYMYTQLHSHHRSLLLQF